MSTQQAGPTPGGVNPAGEHSATGVFRTLLVRSAVALASCAVLVTLCYHFVDRPVAFFAHDHRLDRLPLLRWLPESTTVFKVRNGGNFDFEERKWLSRARLTRLL